MTYRLTVMTLLTALLLPGCESVFMQRFTLTDQPLSWDEYEREDSGKRNKRIKLLKHETQNCSNYAHCAELNYQIAILYLSRKPLNLKDLNTSSDHLNKAIHDGRYREHAAVLNKVLLGWIGETEKNQKLLNNMQKAKEVDLENFIGR